MRGAVRRIQRREDPEALLVEQRARAAGAPAGGRA
jgi:hypothetical protein